VDPDDAPGMPRHNGIVGDQDDGDAVLLIQLLEHFEDVLARSGIEVSCRLIGKNQGRLVDESPGNGHTLLLAAG
jgi:hypothetical protein